MMRITFFLWRPYGRCLVSEASFIPVLKCTFGESVESIFKYSVIIHAEFHQKNTRKNGVSSDYHILLKNVKFQSQKYAGLLHLLYPLNRKCARLELALPSSVYCSKQRQSFSFRNGTRTQQNMLKLGPTTAEVPCTETTSVMEKDRITLDMAIEAFSLRSKETGCGRCGRKRNLKSNSSCRKINSGFVIIHRISNIFQVFQLVICKNLFLLYCYVI